MAIFGGTLASNYGRSPPRMKFWDRGNILAVVRQNPYFLPFTIYLQSAIIKEFKYGTLRLVLNCFALMRDCHHGIAGDHIVTADGRARIQDGAGGVIQAESRKQRLSSLCAGRRRGRGRARYQDRYPPNDRIGVADIVIQGDDGRRHVRFVSVTVLRQLNDVEERFSFLHNIFKEG